MDKMDLFSIKALWGNFSFDYAFSPSIGYSGGILCVWDPRLFVKDNSTVSDSFLVISGTWVPSSTKLLIISIYAPQDHNERRLLWDFLHHLIASWDGEYMLMGDFNEVRFDYERFGLLSLFPSISALCLDKYLSDHRPILLRELAVDYGPTPFRFFSFLLAIRGVLVDGDWISEHVKVKSEFHNHFSNRFAEPTTQGITFDTSFPNRLSPDQIKDLERLVSYDEIKCAVWDCGTNKLVLLSSSIV
ncbi:RNA-directed DNA polymerase, eukaryota, partial [Tanacetum coccineum]